jgi:hypothetical protein
MRTASRDLYAVAQAFWLSTVWRSRASTPSRRRSRSSGRRELLRRHAGVPIFALTFFVGEAPLTASRELLRRRAGVPTHSA